jgi:Tfp pilus assembly ATPase PilU
MAGMVLFDQALVTLYNRGKISYKNLLAFCNEQNEVENLIGSIDNN